MEFPMEFHRGSVQLPEGTRVASEAATRALGALVTQRGDAGSPDRFVVIESCHSTWLFDTADRRFCRVVRNRTHPAGVPTDWRPYDRLVVEDHTDAFVVFLDATGTRLLRSWRHGADCRHCRGDVTAEMSLADLRRVTRA
jgi:hypothetical protein